MTETAAQRILLADDHELIREALERAIRRKVPEAEFAFAGTAAAVWEAVSREEWSLVVLDLGLPGGGEMETLRRVRGLRPAMPILVFSMFPEEKMGVAAIEAGASGYLCKTADRTAVAAAAAATLAGEPYRSPTLRAMLAKRAGERGPALAALSRRELEVLIELGRGRSSKEIAGQLGIGVTSVGTYRARIMEKLALRTNADLVRFVVENGLLRDGADAAPAGGN